MALDAGSVAAVLAARVDDSGFREFDRKVAEANRREAIAGLGAKVDDGGFTEFNAKVKRAGTETGRAKLIADVDEKSFLKYEEKVRRVGKMRAEGKLSLDASDFDRAIDAGEAKLERLKRRRSKALLDLDVRGIARADAEIKSVERNLEHLRHERAEIKVDVDRSTFDRFLSLLRLGGAPSGGGGGDGGGRGLLLGLGGTGGSGRLASSLAGKSLPALTAAALAAEGAVSALGAAFLSLGGALAPLAGTLGVIPGALAGLGQAAGALFATFSGIPSAVKAAFGAEQKSSVDSTAALEQNRAATEAVRGAKQALTNSERTARVAQEQLTQARKDATRQLEDMKNAARDAQLQEQSAGLALQESRARLAQVLADPKSTQLDIQRARLDVKEATQGAREARIEAARAKSDSDHAQAGVVGRMPQVVSARRALADANQSVADSSHALIQAEEQAAARTSKLSASQEKLRESLANLSPAGRRFVQFLVGLKPRLEELRNASQQAALPGFERGIRSALRNFPVLKTALTDTSRVFGETAAAVGRFVGSKGFGRDFASITRTNNNVLRNLGQSLIPLGKAFNNIAVAAEPFTRWIGRATLHLSELFAASTKRGRESGALTRFFHETRVTLEQLGTIALHVTKGLAGLFGAAIPSGHDFLGLLERLSKRFDEWANSARGQNSIRKFLEDSKGPLKDLGEALVSVLRLTKDLIAAPGSGASFSLFTRSIKLLADALDALAKVPLVGGFLSNLALLAVIAGRFGKLGAAITGLRELAGGIRGVTDAEAAASKQSVFRRAGLKIGQLFRGTAPTTVGTEVGADAATGVERGLTTRGGRIRSALGRLFGRSATRTVASQGEQLGFDFAGSAAGGAAAGGGRVRNAIRRIFRRGATDAAESGGSQASGSFVGSVLGGIAGSKLGTRLGPILRSAMAIAGRAGAIGAVIALVTGLEIEWSKHRDQINKVAYKIGHGFGSAIRSAINALDPFGDPLKDKKPRPTQARTPQQAARTGRLAPLGQSLSDRLEAAGQDLTPAEKRQIDQGSRKKGKSAKQAADKAFRDSFREGRATSITYDLSKGIGIAGTQRAFNRLQDVVRREIEQTKRLVARRASDIFDPISRIRLTGGDPLHLGAAVLRSRDEATRAAKRIRANIESVFDDTTALGGSDPLGLGRAVLHSRDEATRSAKRIRANIENVFSGLGVLGGNDPLHLGPAVLHSRDEATRAAKAIRDNIVSVFRSLPGLVSSPVTRMLRIVGSALRALGAGGTARISTSIERIEGRAQGGFTGQIPGYSRTDDTIIAVRGGEGVLRPEDHIPYVDHMFALTKALGVGKFGSLGEMFQRTGAAYHSGGQVVPKPIAQDVVQRIVAARTDNPPALHQDVVQREVRPPGFAAGGVVPAVQRLISVMTSKFPLTVTSTTGGNHVPGSYHYQGKAVDLAGAPEVMLKAAAYAKRAFGSQLLEGIHKPNLSIKDGHTVSPGFWGALWDKHADHIHLAAEGAVRAARQAATRIRARIRGRRGAVRDLVAGGVERVQRAANRRITRAQSSLGGADVADVPSISGSGQGAALMRDISRRRHWNFADWWAIDAVETGHGRNLVNPSSSARLRGQFLDMNWGKYGPGSDPRRHPSMRQQIISMGQYIAERYVNPTRAWAFHKAHNFYAKGGLVGRAVKRLASGGLVGRAVPFMRKIWQLAKPRLGAQDLPMPRAHFGVTPGAEALGEVYWDKGLERMTFAPPAEQMLADHQYGGIRAYLHELAHVFQGFMPGRLGGSEGGAEAWARAIGPVVAKALGVKVERSEHYAYPKETAEARKNREGYLHKQFGLDRHGRRTKAIKGVKPWYEHFARGGIVGRAIQGFANGGSVLRRATGDQNRGRPRPAKGQHKPGKPGKPKRQRRIPASFGISYFDAGKNAFERIYDENTGTLGVAIENYEVDVDDAGVTNESQFYVDQNTNTIQWEWVDKRISEIRRLQGDVDVITGQIQQAISIAARYLDQVKLALQGLYERRRQILTRARELVARIKSLTGAIKDEARKKHSDKDLLAKWRKQLKGHADELDVLTGSRTDIGTGGQLGQTNIQIGDEGQETGLLGLRALFMAGLEDLRGRTGRGGKLHQYAIERAGLDQELAGLAPGELSKQLSGTAGASGPAADIQAFLAGIGDLLKTYGSNFRPLANFARGGRVRERVTGWARGGFAGLLPGYSRQDDTVIAVRGGEGILRPEDHLPYADRMFAVTKALGFGEFGSVGEMFQRTGAKYRAGGEVAHRGPGGLVTALAAAERAFPEIIRPLPRLASGGLVTRAGSSLEVLGDGELVRDAATGKIQLVIKQGDGRPRTVIGQQYNGPVYQEKQDAHLLSRNIKHEIEAAV